MKNIKFSILVITYNFEDIILECLESIERQKYKNFEVIICDDCSKDKTLEICKKWAEKNKENFSIKVIPALKNEGVVKNINKGIKEAQGEWIKSLAGDDLLIEDSLEKINEFIKINSNAEVIMAKAQTFKVENNKKKYLNILPKNKEFYNLSSKKQLEELLEGNIIVAPGVTLKNSLLKRMGYYDETFRMVEDYPFWIKLLKNNIKFYFLDEVIVLYRQGIESVSGRGKNQRTNKFMVEFAKDFYEKIYKKEVKNPIKRWDRYIEIKRKEVILKCGNKSNLLTQMMRWLEIKNLKKYVLRVLIIILILKFLKEIL